MMASIMAKLPPPPPVVVDGRKPPCGTVKKLALPSIGERRGRLAVIAKATSESSESSTSLSVAKNVQNLWDKSEDRLALIGLGFAAVVALWASTNLITAIDKLPVVPSALEFIGILFSTWFTYRYLLFKPDREELFQLNQQVDIRYLGPISRWRDRVVFQFKCLNCSLIDVIADMISQQHEVTYYWMKKNLKIPGEVLRFCIHIPYFLAIGIIL
ncbi:CAAD domain-containing protein [Forsythia ovata]|uniref:CAAD domain-containing protein n=1 Tax=Forsythia ovata TaxID=205694 RepID=A0ABD1PI22_9LAMI